VEKSKSKNYQIASLSKRTTAYFIDDIAVSVLLFIIFYEQLIAIYEKMQDSMDLMPMVTFLEQNTLIFVLLRIIYQTFFVWQNGMTLGKIVVKIRIVDVSSGEKPSFQVAFLRASLRIISDSVLYLGYIFAYFNPLVQTVHDKLAKTVVVNL
jgi:uncharacterized RDD family membrane protein YckC